MNIHIGASYDSFRELRTNGAYYVDKTDVIGEYLTERFDKAVLFARPRRFGKTLTMTMFRDFLDVRQDSRDIFEGLNVMENKELVSNYMNRYPVVFLSLKEVFGLDFSQLLSALRIAVANVCMNLGELEKSERVSEYDKVTFQSLLSKSADEATTVASLNLLSRMLFDHYGRPVFIIIDEYDVPMAKALGKGHYEQTRDMIEHMLSYVCKTNESVKAVMLSGCLYTVKNSTYTGVNNIIPYTVLSPIFATSIGFTDDNVKTLLTDAGIPDRYAAVAEWYDGYLFGREKMYCPWDVLLHVRSVLDGSFSEAMGPESYWLNSSEIPLQIIHGFLGKTSGINESFEKLLAGETIDCIVNDRLPYHRIHESGDNLWSALLETGYLTKAVTERMRMMPLKIPNREIQDVFRQEVWSFFENRVENTFVRDLANALWSGEAKKAEAALGQILEATLSFYHEYHEYSYHLILDGFFTGLGYRVISELETGYGRSDLIILDPARNRCLILELKHVKEKIQMEAALKEADSQIIQKKYDSQLIYLGYTQRHKYGMAFCKKQVLVGNL